MENPNDRRLIMDVGLLEERIEELEQTLQAIWVDGRMPDILLGLIEKAIPNSKVIAMYKDDPRNRGGT